MVGSPAQPELHGHVDIVTPLLVAGWVRDLTAADRRLELQLVHNGAVLAVTRAEMMRPDVAQAGIGDGAYGFQFHAITPDQPLPPGPATVRDALTGIVIPQGAVIIPGEAPAAAPPPPQLPPPTPAPAPQLEGHVDRVSAGLVGGWVRDLAAQDQRLELHLRQDGQLVGAAMADETRADLREAGIGDGSYGFTLADLLPEQPWRPGPASIHDARTGAVIPGGFITLPAEAGTAPVFAWTAMANTAADVDAAPVATDSAPIAPAPATEPCVPSAPEPGPEPGPEPPAPPDPVAPPAVPPIEPLPADVLRGLLPAGSALKVFAIELAMQAHDAPALSPEPGPFSPADAIAYFAMVRRYRPGQVIEFGDGAGTPFAMAALQANGRGQLLRVAPTPSSLPEIVHCATPAPELPDAWLAKRVTAGDMVVLHPGLDPAAALDILQRLLPACPVGLHVHLHGLPVLTGEFPAGQQGQDAHALMQAWIDGRQLSLLYATAWHAMHNPAGLDALMRGRAAGGGGSLWLYHRPAR